MGFWTKSKTLKCIRIFLLFIIFVIIVILLLKIREIEHFKIYQCKEECWNFQNLSISDYKNITSTTPFKNYFSEKEQMQEVDGSFRAHTMKIKSKRQKSKRTSKKPFSFQSESQEYCLKKYMLDVHELFSDPKRILELITTKVSEAYMFTSFHRMAEILNVKIGLIEPSLLYCMMPIKHRKLLSKRNFNLSDFTRSDNVMTFGILGEDASVLQKEENIHEFRNMGLQPNFVEVPLAPWMEVDDAQFENGKYTSHIFYTYYEWTFHVVVFYKRHNYLWHAELKQDDKHIFIPENQLLFANYDSAYENFNFQSILQKNSNFSSVYIPSNAHYFLFQMPSSRFLECNSSRFDIETFSTTRNSAAVSDFNKKILVALRELKIFFQNVLMDFWIFSGTLLGWYRQCGVISYTTDVDFGAWASEMDDLDYFIKHFQRNQKLYLLERMGFLEEGLEFQLRSSDLRVDLFFIYEMDNGTWASGHRPSKGYYFKYHYPFFTLCSAELLHEKVQVPCEADDVILIEYGNQWVNPIESWDYESSIHNRGPNIYWDDERRPKAFRSY